MIDGSVERRALLSGLAATAASPSMAAQVARPKGYPRSYDRLISAAEREGRLVIYSSTELRGFSQVLSGFKARYPFLDVRYHLLRTRETYDRVVGESATRRPTGDFLFSSAMDQQIKLVNDGYAQAYASPEKPNLPEWAVWKNEAYAISAEPVVFAYHRRHLPVRDVPRSHQALQSLLERKRSVYWGKVGLYDPAINSTGFLYMTQDVQLYRGNWKLLQAIGRTRPKLFSGSQEMIRQLSTGELLLGYNMIGSNAFAQQRRDPDFRAVIPDDYALVASRIGVIIKDAQHPAAAKLFLDYVLSQEGRVVVARHDMSPVRTDVGRAETAIDPDTARVIPVGPGLLVSLDQLTRAKFLSRWNDIISG